jgi:hypothetical protein
MHPAQGSPLIVSWVIIAQVGAGVKLRGVEIGKRRLDIDNPGSLDYTTAVSRPGVWTNCDSKQE